MSGYSPIASLHPISCYENSIFSLTVSYYHNGGYELINAALYWKSYTFEFQFVFLSLTYYVAARQLSLINLSAHLLSLSLSLLLHRIKPLISVLDQQFDFPLFSRQRRNLRGIQPRSYICCFFHLITSRWGFLFCLRVAASALLSLPRARTLSISHRDYTNFGQHQPIIEAVVESFVSAYTIN